MIGGLIVAVPAGPRRSWLQRALRRKPTLTPRQLGAVVSTLQQAEARNMHADRERCVGCKIAAGVMHHMGMAHLPARFAKDKDWMHRHVEMPGARLFARMLDHREGER